MAPAVSAIHARVPARPRSGSRAAAPLLLQLAAFLLEALEHLQRRSAFVGHAETPVDSRQHVVIGRGPLVEGDRLVERVHRRVQAPFPLVRPSLLEPRPIGLRIELDRLAGVFERLVRISRAIVVRAQVHVSGAEAAPARRVQLDGFLILRDRAGIVSQRFQREAQGVERLDVRRIDPKRRLECLPRGLPVVLDGKELAEVVVRLGGIRLVAEGLLELDLGGVESPDDHQIAPEDLVRFGVSNVELERLGQRLDRFADLLLREQAVAERVPAPRRGRALLDVLGKERLDLLEPALADEAFELRDPAGVVYRGRRQRARLGPAEAGRHLRALPCFSSTCAR